MDNQLKIKEHLNSKELFEAFKMQLKKDLEECACDGTFVNELEPEFDGIKQKLIQVIKHNEKRSHFNLQQLLYRVDINEKRLSTELAENKNEDYVAVVAELIIKRILQKIVLKKHFSNHENQNRIQD